MDSTYMDELRKGRRLEELLKLLPESEKEKLTYVATGLALAQEAGKERKSA